MLKLTDLIKLSGIALGNYKLHFATDNKASDWRPLQAYFAGTFEWGQARQGQKNFKCENVLSLINLGTGKRWLFVGVYRVDGVRPDNEYGGSLYTLTRLPGLDHLDGRAIIDFPKLFRNCYPFGAKHENALLVYAIREEKLSIADFPGFNGVRLSFEILASIIRHDNPSWRAALANVAGVYVITDTKTGKLYVGKASGGVGLWQRWTEYVKTGHGDNKELRELLNREGQAYANNFQFSLVEVCDINASPDYVISRECHWKNVLMTREFGLNSN
jgi:hypothetical protein